jgi:hypothetical protein
MKTVDGNTFKGADQASLGGEDEEAKLESGVFHP